MTDEEFNKYCAEVMGYELMKMNRLLYAPTRDGWDSPELYDPVNDLNQMAEVFDKLWHGALVEELWLMPDTENNLVEDIAQKGIAQAMREFIESTKEE